MTVAPFVDRVRRAVKSQADAEFIRYFGCSALALATDLLLFNLGLRLGADYAAAAALAYLAGMIVAYALSIRFVFRTRSLADARLEFMIFAAIGLVGLSMTELLLWLLVSGAGLSPGLAKLPTAGCVFLFNFGARKALLFSHPQLLRST